MRITFVIAGAKKAHGGPFVKNGFNRLKAPRPMANGQWPRATLALPGSRRLLLSGRFFRRNMMNRIASGPPVCAGAHDAAGCHAPEPPIPYIP